MLIRGLGPVEVVVDGVAVDLGRPKQRALFALLLAAADTVVAVDTIVDRLWGGQPPASAMASLQVYVSNLRRVLEPGRGPGTPAAVLVTRAPGYVLRTDGATVDVRVFVELITGARAALAVGRADDALAGLDEALGLWRGDAYADVRDASWIAPEVARLGELRLGAVEDRADALIRLGRPAEAAADLEAFIAGHPLRERALSLMALGLYRCGRPADALGALRSVRARLAEELGVDPGPDLVTLEMAILRHDRRLAPPPVVPAWRPGAADAVALPAAGTGASVTVVTDDLFVGRGGDLANLLGELGPPSAAPGPIIMIDGEPGVGKTRLVAEVCARAGRPALWGVCPNHEVAPALWPWEQVLRALAAARPDLPLPPEVAALLSQRRQDGGYDATGARLRLYEAVTNYLASAAPLLVVLDDLQWADTSSLRLIVHLGAGRAPGVGLIGTFRTHERAVLEETLAGLARTGLRTARLGGLDAAAVRDLARDVARADPGWEAAGALRSRTGGNPFFVRELLRFPGGSGQAGALPDHVRDVIHRRVAALPASAAALLETAAVAGAEFDADIVAEVAGFAQLASLEALDAALAAGLISEHPSRLGGFRFDHDLIREALDARHTRLRRALLHRRFGEVTARRYADRPERTGQVARHWLAAAELSPEVARAAVEQAARAAREAADRLAPEDAAGYWQGALAAAEFARLGGGERVELLLGLLDALYAAGKHFEGLEIVDRALAEAGGDPGQVARIADAAMGHTVWFPFSYGTVPGALRSALAAALPLLPAEDPRRCVALVCAAVVATQAGDVDEGARLSAAALRACRALPDGPDLLARILHLRSLAVSEVDRPNEQRDAAAELIAMGAAPRELVAGARLRLACDRARLGQIGEAWSALLAAEEEMRRLRSPALAAQAGFVRAALLAFAGRLDESAAAADAAVSTVDPAAQNGIVASYGANMIDRALQAGALAAAAQEMRAVAAGSKVAAFRGVLALALAEAGCTGEAREVLASVELPPRDYTWWGAVVIRLLAAIMLGCHDIVEQDRAHLRPFSGQLVVIGSCTAIIGAVDGLLGEASLALGDHPAARRELTAAIALLDRCGSPYWAARARQALARCP
ncbi:transcriptional regulator [Pseudofrankia sp. BMG5.36]|nr:AfsR/SARP family transcriptional regulator [Pseudofrankia sp. BMG5.36]OHV43491.1 transcriptional regulator [Pseudofrankia sp. BMG5.36]